MSDYLTNVAARAIDAAPIIRPRLASMFEPPAMTGVTPELETRVETAARDTPVDEAPAAPETRAVPHEVDVARADFVAKTKAFVASPAPAAHETVLQESRAATIESPKPSSLQPAAPPPTPPRTQPVPFERPAAAAEVAPLARSTPETARPEERRAAVAPQTERVIERIRQIAAPPERGPLARTDRESRPVATPPDQRGRDSLTPPAPVEAPPKRIERTLVEVRQASRLLVPPVPAAKSSTRIAIEPRARPYPRPPVPERIAAARDAAPEPDVHVTIGRIEVRAVAAVETPAPRRATPAAHMSLDDYLRRRTEKGRP